METKQAVELKTLWALGKQHRPQRATQKGEGISLLPTSDLEVGLEAFIALDRMPSGEAARPEGHYLLPRKSLGNNPGELQDLTMYVDAIGQ